MVTALATAKKLVNMCYYLQLTTFTNGVLKGEILFTKTKFMLKDKISFWKRKVLYSLHKTFF